MLSVALAVLVWLPAIIGLGAVLPAPVDPALRRGVAGLLGLGVLGVLAMLVQLAVPLTPLASSCLWLAGMAVLVARRRWIGEGASGVELAGCAAAIILSLFWVQAPTALYDGGLYYLQSARWMTEHPIRLGLGNLHGRLAFNSLWLSVASGVELPLLSGHGSTFVNVLPPAYAGGLAAVGLRGLVAGQRTWLSASLALLFPVVGHATGGVGASSPDQVSALCVVLALALLVQALGEDDAGFATDARAAALLALLAVLVKLSAAPVLLAVGAAVVLRRRAVTARWLASLAVPCAIAVLAWSARTLLLSGCVLYPVAWTCAPGLPWAEPLDRVQLEAELIRAWARMPFVMPAEVPPGWAWIPAWAVRMLRRDDVPMYLGTIAAAMAPLLWVRPRGPGLSIVLGTCGLGVAYVFVAAPDPRFASGFLHALGLFPLAYALTRLTARRPAVAGVLVLACVVAVTLRWARIGHHQRPWRLDPVAFPVPPEAQLVERENGHGTRAQVPANGDQCWAAPPPCTPELDPRLVERGRMYSMRQPVGAIKASGREHTGSAARP